MPTATPFNNLITFSRGSNATLTGSNGLIQWAPNNLLTFSEQFDNAAWTKTAATITANNAAAPDGTTTADTITEDTSNGGHSADGASVSFVSGVSYTLSVYAKAAIGTRGVCLRLSSSAFPSSSRTAFFSIANGTVVSNEAGTTAAITDVGNGWYRCALTATANATAAATGAFIVMTDASNNRVYTGDGTGSLRIWGAQLELGSTATTYNPTTVKNLLGFSEAFDNAGWSKGNSSIVTGAQANPVNGLFNAQKLMENTANNSHVVQQALTVANGVTHVASVYAKAGERSWLTIGTSGFGTGYTYFNLANGTIGTVLAGHTASITAIGNGWYRCSIAATSTATSATIFYGTTSTNGVSNYTGDGNSGVYIYGAQLSDSASLDPYVPTPGAAPSSTAFYGPRFDYDPVTLAPRGILIEEQRTNLALRSEEFNDVAWAAGPIPTSVTANTGTSPSGLINADTATFNVTTFALRQLASVSNGTTYTLSVWVKASASGGATNVRLTANNAATWTGATSTKVTLTNQWQRVTLQWTANATSIYFIIGSPDATGVNDTTCYGNVDIYGAQLEAGAFATSYIPTVASTVTRNADSPSITGSNFSGWFNAAAGAFVADFSVSGIDASSRRKVWNGIDSGNQRLALRSTDTAPTFPLGAVGTGTSVVSLNGAPMTANIPAKVALAYGANSALSQNGLTTATDANVNSVAPTSFGIGWDQAAIGQYLNGHIRNIRFIPARAADFQLQALTELPLVPTLDLDFLNNLYEA